MALFDFLPVVGSIASSIGNAVSTNKTNKTNMAINQMNNEFNAAEAEKARQFQLDMWNRANEYNSASARRSRLEEADLNPYLMMNGDSAGTAQSAGSSSPATAAPPLSMQRQDFSGLSSTLSSALQILNQSKVADAQVQNLQGQKSLADAQSQQILSNVDWYKLGPEYKNWLKTTGAVRANLSLNTDKQQLENMQWTQKVMNAQRTNLLLSGESQRVINKYLDQSQRLQLNIYASQYYDLMASGHLKYEQALTEIAKRIDYYASAEGKRISNSIARETAASYIDALNAQHSSDTQYYKGFGKGAFNAGINDTWSKYYDTKQKSWNYSKRFWDEGLNASRTIGNSIGTFRIR